MSATRSEFAEPGRCATLAAGAHGPIALTARMMAARDAAYYYHLAAVPTLQLWYVGHRDDLVAAGCIELESLGARHGRFHDDGNGGLWYLSSKAGRGKRGWLQVSYYVTNRALASSLPGALALMPEGIAAMCAPPMLRLVVDNTRVRQ